MMVELLDQWTGGLPLDALAIAILGYFLGGFVKGAIGFALPMVSVTVAASVLPATTAVALVILPVLVSNISQAFGQGMDAFRASWKRFRNMAIGNAVMIIAAAQMLPSLDERAFFAILGAGAGAAAFAQLIGWRPTVNPKNEPAMTLGVGLFAGFMGGIAGIWGPPTILYFTALRLSKEDQVRAAGLVFFFGGITLVPAHVVSGVLDAQSAALSVMMIAPVLIGQWFGRFAQKRMDVELFRKITLLVLLIVSLNLLRRALL